MSDYLKSKVSRMYYLSDISKTEIGQHLGISRFRVSRLLEQARDEGIVQIQINEPTDTNTEIEDQLEKRFNLPLAIVVNPSDPTYPGTMRAIGAAAADYLKNLVSDGDVIGITWGATVDDVVNYMPSKMDRRLQVVQITGGLNQSYINLNPTDLVRRVADIFSTKANLLFAPAIVGNPATRACMMEDSSFKETISLFDRVTIAISGIGALSSSVDPLYLTAGYLQKEDLINLRESKAVGDVFGHFFNVHGELCNPELETRTIGIEPRQLKKVGCSIAVAGGNHKSLAILGALRGQFINTLVTNLSTAIDILEKDLILTR